LHGHRHLKADLKPDSLLPERRIRFTQGRIGNRWLNGFARKSAHFMNDKMHAHRVLGSSIVANQRQS
jgi:hypothetical protein